jgi:hypothetical protein
MRAELIPWKTGLGACAVDVSANLFEHSEQAFKVSRAKCSLSKVMISI